MVYTIGYAGVDIERFVKILKDNRINLLIDVRSLPKSRYFYQFNDTSLCKVLATNGVEYQNWKTEFGARQENLDFFTDGILDYAKFAKSEQFIRGIENVKDLVAEGKTICLMCAEIDPLICHRAILCAKELFANGLDVTHIIAKRNGETLLESHKDFEGRLLAQTKVNNLSEAYRKQNKKIGYKLT